MITIFHTIVVHLTCYSSNACLSILKFIHIKVECVDSVSKFTYFSAKNGRLKGFTNASRVSHFWASKNTPFGSQGTELWEPIFTFGCFSLKAVYNSCKLQGPLEAAKFLCMCSFTTLLFRHLPTEIVNFINVCY